MCASPNLKSSPVDGLCIINKSRGPTSHDIVQKARKFFQTRKIGHAGTLDPMATGVLILGVGEGTKLITHLINQSKKYRTTIQLGQETDSLDATGTVTQTKEVPKSISSDQIQKVFANFLGIISQQVPEVSAIKQKGVPLYKRKMRGEKIHAPVREVILHDLKLLNFKDNQIHCEIHCGKGFYVRSFARDLANQMGTVGHLIQLERTQSGLFQIGKAHQDQILFEGSLASTQPDPGSILLPIESGLEGMNCFEINTQQEDDIRHGRSILIDKKVNCIPDKSLEEKTIALTNAKGQLVAFAESQNEILKPKRVFNYSYTQSVQS